MIRAARIENSPRLKAVLAVLQRGGWWTAREIRQATDDAVEAVPTAIQELKANGIEVECRYMEGQYRYRCLPPRPSATPPKIGGEFADESLAEFRARHGCPERIAPEGEQKELFG